MANTFTINGTNFPAAVDYLEANYDGDLLDFMAEAVQYLTSAGGITLVATQPGWPLPDGTKYTFSRVNSGASQALSVACTMTQATRSIAVTLATDAGGVITSTRQNVADTINAHPIANDWVTATASSGATLATTLSNTNFGARIIEMDERKASLLRNAIYNGLPIFNES